MCSSFVLLAVLARATDTWAWRTQASKASKGKATKAAKGKGKRNKKAAKLMSSDAGTASRPAFAAGSAVFGTAAVFVAIGVIIRMRNKDEVVNHNIPENPEVGMDANEHTHMLA